MKKLLFLLFPAVIFAQDRTRLCELSLDETKAVAENIAKLSQTYIYEDFAKDAGAYGGFQVYKMVPNTISKDQRKKMADDGVRCDECFTLKFKKFIKGENPDLKISGTATYKLDVFDAQFLRIFPVWKEYFRPDITLENYRERAKQEIYKGNMAMARFRDEGNGNWDIILYNCHYR